MADEHAIGFLVYEGCDLFDIAGPAEVFRFVENRLASRPDDPIPRAYYFSPDGGVITTGQRLPVVTRAINEIDRCNLDTLIVVGSFDADRTSDPRLVACIAHHAGSIRRIASVCTGAFVLARAGVLDGHRAVTHWQDCDALAQNFPAVTVDPSCIFIEDRRVWTSAGITAGIDMALAMVEQDYGPEMAMSVAQAMVVFLKRPGGQAQVSMALKSQEPAGQIRALVKWIMEHPGDDLRAEALAERAHMSLRNFYRAFEQATGTTPAEWVEAVRLEVAKRLLEQTDDLAEQIAFKAGFGSYEQMRRTFAKRLGSSPLAYRSLTPGHMHTPEPASLLRVRRVSVAQAGYEQAVRN
jgi:transcriptional regulator GlxA family with amidase domain